MCGCYLQQVANVEICPDISREPYTIKEGAVVATEIADLPILVHATQFSMPS